jgi:L-rhamnose mutarotase
LARCAGNDQVLPHAELLNLFSYFEYTGTDYKADMARMAADETTQKWWSFCIPCQKPLSDREPGEWWAGMEEVFHTD